MAKNPKHKPEGIRKKVKPPKPKKKGKKGKGSK